MIFPKTHEESSNYPRQKKNICRPKKQAQFGELMRSSMLLTGARVTSYIIVGWGRLRGNVYRADLSRVSCVSASRSCSGYWKQLHFNLLLDGEVACSQSALYEILISRLCLDLGYSHLIKQQSWPELLHFEWKWQERMTQYTPCLHK